MAAREEYERTNLFVIDKDVWEWAKYRANVFGYKSVSEYIFDLLKLDKFSDVFENRVLLALEKYYEIIHYTLGIVAEEANVSISDLHAFMRKFDLPIITSIQDRDEGSDKIHKLLIKRDILPRELKISKEIAEARQAKKTLESRDLLSIIFPNEEERKIVVLETLRNYITRNMETIKKTKCETCQEKDTCEEDNIEILREKFGILIEHEDIEEDPVYLELKKMKTPQVYTKLLETIILCIVDKEMERIIKVKATLRPPPIAEELYQKIHSSCKEQIKTQKEKYNIDFKEELIGY